MSISSEKTTVTHIDADGNVTTDTTERTRNIKKNEEPEFIKIYKRMWCEFNCIPEPARDLFLYLACNMDYARGDSESSQLVYTGQLICKNYCDSHNIQRNRYQTLLKMLCDCGALKKVGRGLYQVNPNYASKGEWTFNPKYNRGGVEDLIATFDFKEKTVSTRVVESASKEADVQNQVEDSVFDMPENMYFDNIVQKESRVY